MTSATPKNAVAAIAGTVAAIAPRIAHACAMCGLSPGDGAGHAFNTSVLFMLSGPYVTFGLIGGLVFLVYRRKVRTDRKPGVSALKP